MNNEMDELFRKAGEDYPLNLGKPDWDAVAGKLQTDTGDAGPVFGLAADGPRKKRRYLWLLLLLLPAGIYGLMQTGKNAEKNSGSPVDTSRGTEPPAETGKKSAGDRADGHQRQETAFGANRLSLTAPEKDAADNEKAVVRPSGSVGTSASSASNKTGASRSSANATDITARKEPKRESHSLGSRGANETKGSAGTNGNRSKTQIPDAGTAVSGRTPLSSAPLPKTDQGLTNGSSKAGDKAENLTTPKDDAVPANADATTDDSCTGQSALADMVMTDKAKETKSATQQKPAAGNTSKQKDSAGNKKQLVHPSVAQQRGFYAGITAAPDFSTVKFQSMKSTGYSFGVVAGYRLSNHFSLETGLSWDRKKYYSKGEYFDKSKTKIPSTVTVNYIDGHCDMFEIPITVRYNLNAGKKGHWFAAAGFSSYLMKDENYLYGAETNNVPWSRYVDYKNSGNNFFSIMQFSAGYELNWSSRNRIRVEPYFKAPISGVGIGSLPISSLGMTFGFIHSFR